MKSRNMNEADLRKNLAQELKIKKAIEAHVNTNQVVTEVEAREFYQQEKERFQMPESAQARHILIKVDQEDNAKAKAEKKAKIEDLRKKLLAGADFAALAKEHSDCPSGLRSGGDLGTFSRGQMVPAFENAAFNQPLKEIGPVVETSFGYHIIQVIERNKEKTLAYDEVKDKIMDGLKMKREQEAFKEYLQTLKAKATIVYDESVMPVAPESMPGGMSPNKTPVRMPMNTGAPKMMAPAGK
jgi:peptidyl-prolyl cis-trans isomerase C